MNRNSEFERSRLIRLGQVRQQSKIIAENIRTKVMNEKLKGNTVLKDMGLKNLKLQEARKLLDVHTQCQQTLKDFGNAHKCNPHYYDDLNVIGTSQSLLSVPLNTKAKATRSYAAPLTRTVNKMPNNTPVSTRTENPKTDVEHFIIPVETAKPICKDKSCNVTLDYNSNELRSFEVDRNISSLRENMICRDPIDTVAITSVTEHINKRSIALPEVDRECSYMQTLPTCDCCEYCAAKENLSSRTWHKCKCFNTDTIQKSTACTHFQDKATQIVMETKNKSTSPNEKEFRKKEILSYSKNRPLNEEEQAHAKEEKLCSTILNDGDYNDDAGFSLYVDDIKQYSDEKMKFYEQKAEERGQQAIEKELVRRAYSDLLKRLPLLQKQERINQLANRDCSKFHMSNARQNQSTQKKQIVLENAYRNLLRTTNDDSSPVEYSHIASNTLNNKSSEKENRTTDTTNSKCKQEKLLQLLNDLKNQKNALLQEIEDLKAGPQEPIRLTQKKSPPISTLKDSKKIDQVHQPTENRFECQCQDANTQTKTLKDKGNAIDRTVLTDHNNKISTTARLLNNQVEKATSTCGLSEKALESTYLRKIPINNLDELCQIIINIKGMDPPNIIVNKKEDVSEGHAVVASIKDTPKTDLSRNLKTTKQSTSRTCPCKSKRTVPVSEQNRYPSWSFSTATTSYYSPPGNEPGYNNVPHNSTEQLNCTDVNNKLYEYIRKMLTASRESIAKLTVSSPSDVLTPTESVIDIDSNNPLNQDQNYILPCNNFNPDHLNKSSDIAEIETTYGEKIGNINKMIKKVRNEKKRILECSPYNANESNSATMYLSFDDEQRRLNEELLAIDKVITPTKHKQNVTHNNDEQCSLDEIDKEFMKRYRRLKQFDTSAQSSPDRNHVSNNSNILRAKNNSSVHKRPPPSKGITIIKRFNGNALGAPHELSTIIEADSNLTEQGNASQLNREHVAVLQRQNNANNQSKTSTSLTTSSSSSTEERSDVELTIKMLQDIGMDWAVPLLKKTKQSLALLSSSNSPELTDNSGASTNPPKCKNDEKSCNVGDMDGSNNSLQRDFVFTNSDDIECRTSTPISDLRKQQMENEPSQETLNSK